ncbi:MAG: polysaccharide biosynthesis/export family protein [Terracidiphilus sp.]
MAISSGQLSSAAQIDSKHSIPPTARSEAQSSASNGPNAPGYIIGNEDVLAINVWKEQDLTRSIPVRSDGKISLPLVGEIPAAGRTPLQLELEITDRLRSYMTDPVVTVMVEQINSKKFNILGQVMKPGSYSVTAATNVVDAIALAGGFRDFAKKKGVYILRQGPDGSESRIPFNYTDFIKGRHNVKNITLQPNDTVIVP